MTIPTTLGDPAALVLVLEDGNENIYPRANIYAVGSAVPVATKDLDHIIDGRYEGSWTPTSVGVYTAHFLIFSDVARTTESIVYTREAEQIFVSQSSSDDLAAGMTRILGLVHENAFVDQTIFDLANQLTSARVRIFDSKANAQSATDGGSEMTGLVATYLMESAYESVGRMKTYRMVRDS